MDGKGTRLEEIEHDFGINKSRMMAKLDYIQSATGLFLALFVWAHLFLESSILLGKDAMYNVSKLLEGEFVFGEPYPIIITIIAIIIGLILFVHAVVAARKFPGSYKQYKVFKSHTLRMNHLDTKLWFIQVATGFVLFFTATVHIYVVMSHPAEIGPYLSSDRMIKEWMLPLYVLLLITSVLHANIGFYRLSIKWGWFEGKNAKKSRKILQKIRNISIVFFIGLGLLSIFNYAKIGLEDTRPHTGERYIPTHETEVK